jgi:hypothetical protein
LCAETEKKLELKIPEILWQSLLDQEFHWFLNGYLSQQEDTDEAGHMDSTEDVEDTDVIDVKKNAIRYTAGFIIRKLEEKYSRQNSIEFKLYSSAVHAMAGKLDTKNSTAIHLQQTSNEWMNRVNRGGLYYVEDAVFDLFVTIDAVVDSKLTRILNDCGKGIEQVKKEFTVGM